MVSDVNNGELAPTQLMSGANPPGSCPVLFSLNPSLLHREYALPLGDTTVGRDAACEIVISGATISRRHFRVINRGAAGVVLEDLNSTNGVYVNRRRVEREVVLQDGDLIGIGSPQPEHLRFQLESGRNRPWTLTLPAKDAWSIGRAPFNDIALSFESTVSSRHAEVRRKGDRVEVADLGSLNGTWVNGRRVRRATVVPTDALTIGSTTLRLQLRSDGVLQVVRRDCGDEIALEAVSLTRAVRSRRLGLGGTRTRRILQAVTLAIRPGEFVGVLGPSGAGKSTLLKALNGYQPPSYGCVLLNETPLYQSYAMFRNVIGYVPQDDIVHPDLTVEDSLDYVARLRLPADVSREQRQDLIHSTLETLGLSHVRKNRVCELSGGQRKRVSIGCELITRPSMLFLDEPTSGMDPSTEERLMRHFQGMARHGTTVLITTHILYNLDLLDRVVILARGRLVFFGGPKEAMGFFALNGRPIERPTEIFEALEITEPTPGTARSEDPKDTVAEAYERKYLESELFRKHVAEGLSHVAADLLAVSNQARDSVDRMARPALPVTPASPTARSVSETKHYDALLRHPMGRTGMRSGRRFDFFSGRAFLTLTQRQFAIKLVSAKRAVFYLAVPFLLALVTLSLRTSEIRDDAVVEAEREKLRTQLHGGRVDLGNPIKEILSPDGAEDPRPAVDVVYALQHEGIANLPTPLSVLLMFVMTAVFMGTLMACLDLSMERPIYLRERMANQRIADYLASKLPFLMLVTALQCAVFVAVCRLKPGLRQFDLAGAYFALVMMAWTSCALGLFLSGLDPTPGQFSVILAIVAVLPQLVLSGGLGPDFYKGMPWAMRKTADLFPARRGLEMLLTAFFHHPGRKSIAWVKEFVTDTMGFQFGLRVYWVNSLALLAQAVGWLGLCSLFVKRLDRAR